MKKGFPLPRTALPCAGTKGAFAVPPSLKRAQRAVFTSCAPCIGGGPSGIGRLRQRRVLRRSPPPFQPRSGSLCEKTMRNHSFGPGAGPGTVPILSQRGGFCKRALLQSVEKPKVGRCCPQTALCGPPRRMAWRASDCGSPSGCPRPRCCAPLSWFAGNVLRHKG